MIKGRDNTVTETLAVSNHGAEVLADHPTQSAITAGFQGFGNLVQIKVSTRRAGRQSGDGHDLIHDARPEKTGLSGIGTETARDSHLSGHTLDLLQCHLLAFHTGSQGDELVSVLEQGSLTLIAGNLTNGVGDRHHT